MSVQPTTSLKQCFEYGYVLRQCLSQAQRARLFPEEGRAVIQICRKWRIELEAEWHPLGFGILTKITNRERAHAELLQILQDKPAMIGTVFLLDKEQAPESSAQGQLFWETTP